MQKQTESRSNPAKAEQFYDVLGFSPAPKSGAGEKVKRNYLSSRAAFSMVAPAVQDDQAQLKHAIGVFGWTKIICPVTLRF